MTREEKEQWDIFMSIWIIPALKNTWGEKKCKEIVEALEEWEEQEPMTAEEYRQRMIQAFHNANTDELIAICVLPTEKEFEHLKWLLKNHYKQKTKIGYWIIKDCKEQGYDIGGVKTWYIQIKCSECGFIKTAIEGHTGQYHYCPHCGAKMVEPQESEKDEHMTADEFAELFTGRDKE